MHYFDYAATTKPSRLALETYLKISSEIYGNPGSSLDAKKVDQKVHQDFLNDLNLSEEYEIVFTSGGTEANNLAITGVLEGRFDGMMNVLTSDFEHASVFDVLEHYHPKIKTKYSPIDSFGYVDIEEFKKLLTPEINFVSIMHVNNEIGTLQPIEELYKIVKEYNSEIIFMVDGVQGIGKVAPLKIKPDLYTLSSHKIYGPKAVGALVKRKDIKVNKIIHGGTKENNFRGGTQSLGAQVAFQKSLNLILKDNSLILSRTRKIKNYLEEELKFLPNVELNISGDSNVVSIFIDVDVTAKIGLEWFYKNDVLLSSKSADSTDFRKKSRTLKAIGLSDYRADRTYRISLSHHQEKKEIDFLINKIKSFSSQQAKSTLIKVKTKEQIKEHYNLRKEVFVTEQNFSIDNEFDKYDINYNQSKDSGHYNLYDNQELIGTIRTLETKNEIKLGRIAIKEKFRSQKKGELLVQLIMDRLDYINKKYYLESQIPAVGFYEKLGFVVVGEKILEENIEHIGMEKQI